MLNKIKDSFVRSGFGSRLAGAAGSDPKKKSGAAVHDEVESEKPIALTHQHLGQVQWIAKAYNYQFTEREGNKGYTLNGNIAGKPCKFERGYPSRSYIHGIELRARAELDLPADIAFLLVNRSLKMNVHNDMPSGFADSMMTSVDLEQPEEVLWMSLFSEVRIPNASEHFITDYVVLSEEEQHAQLLCQPELVQLLLTMPRYDADRAFVLMLARGKLYLRMRYIDDTFMLEHAMQIFHAAAKLALLNANKFVR